MGPVTTTEGAAAAPVTATSGQLMSAAGLVESSTKATRRPRRQQQQHLTAGDNKHHRRAPGVPRQQQHTARANKQLQQLQCGRGPRSSHTPDHATSNIVDDLPAAAAADKQCEAQRTPAAAAGSSGGFSSGQLPQQVAAAALKARTEGGDGGGKASPPQAAWSDLPQQSQQQQLLGVVGKTKRTAAAATSFVALKPGLQPWPSATGTGQRSLKRTQTSLVPDFGYAEQQNPKDSEQQQQNMPNAQARMMGVGHPAGGQAQVKQQRGVELHQALPAFMADTGVSKQQQHSRQQQRGVELHRVPPAFVADTGVSKQQQQQQHSRLQQSLQHRGQQGHEHVTRTHWRHSDGEEGQAGFLMMSRKKLKVRQQQ